MYTSRIAKPNMTMQFIEPIDERIVRLKLTCDLSHETDDVSDIALSFFTDILATKTSTRDKEAIISYLNRYGIQLSIDAGIREITCTLSVARRNLKQALSILSDILQNATVDAGEFSRTKKRTLEELREAKDNAKLIARINFHRALYNPLDPRYFHTIDEQRAIAEMLTKAHFTKLKQKMLAGTWSLSAVVGAPERKLIERFALSFAHDATREVSSPPEAPRRTATKIYETVPGRTNVELRIGQRISLTQADPAYPALLFGLAILGDVGGFGGRLMSTVREKEGLTYGIYARVEQTKPECPGHWNIFTFFTAKDLKKGLVSTQRELDLLLAKGITDRESAVFKEMIRNEFLIMHESNERRLNLYHSLLLSGLGEEWVQEYQQRISTLTKKEVNAALRAHLDPKQLVISGAGPVSPRGEGIV